MAEQKLGDLTITWLTKFIQQTLKNFPLEFFDQLGIGTLIVTKKLTIQDKVEFPNQTIRLIGSQGQPAFTNSWVNYGAPYSSAGFLKRPDGWVELVGVIRTGTVGSAAFTLPPGFRPTASKPLAVMSNGVFGRVDVGADGTVTPMSPSNNASVVLDGLHFKTA